MSEVKHGSTKERGLTFLDKEEDELASQIFLHLPYFIPSNNKGESEANEIKWIVFTSLAKHYRISPSDVKIKLAEYNRF